MMNKLEVWDSELYDQALINNEDRRVNAKSTNLVGHLGEFKHIRFIKRNN